MKETRTRMRIALCLALSLVLSVCGMAFTAFADGAETVNTLDLIETSVGVAAPSATGNLTVKSFPNNGNNESNNGSEHTYAGVRIPLSAAETKADYRVNGLFENSLEFQYLFDTDGTNKYQNSDVYFIFGDKDGNEIFRIGRSITNWAQWQSAAAYVRYTDAATAQVRYSTFGYDGEWKMYYPWELDTDYKANTPDVANTLWPDGGKCTLGDTWGDMCLFPGVGINSTTDSTKVGYPATVKVSYGTRLSSTNGGDTQNGDDHKLFITVDGLNPFNSGGSVQTWMIGEIDGSTNPAIADAMQSGFTFSICTDRSIHTGVAPDVVLLSVNKQALSAESIAVTEPTSPLTHVYYAGAYAVGDKTYIDTVVGEELGAFTVHTADKQIADGWQILGAPEQQTASGFDNTKVGLQTVTVEGKEYNVFVAPEAKLIEGVGNAPATSTATIEAYDPLDFYSGTDNAWNDDATVTPTIYKGIRIPLSDETVAKAEYKVNGTFTNGFSAEYIFGSAGENTSDVYFVFKDLQGKEIFRVGRAVSDRRDWSQMPAYVRYKDAAKSGAYRYSSWVNFQLQYPWEATGVTNGANLSNETPDSITARYPNSDSLKANDDADWWYGSMYFHPGCYTTGRVGAQGAGFVDLDKLQQRAGCITVKRSDDKTKLEIYHNGTNTMNMSYQTYMIGEIDLSANEDIKKAIESGFTFSVCKDQTVHSAKPSDVVLLGINDMPLTETRLRYTSNVQTAFTYQGYTDSDAWYVAANGKVQGVTANTIWNVADGWKISNTVAATVKNGDDDVIAGETSYSTAGTQTLTCSVAAADAFGFTDSQNLPLTVEASKKLTYQTNYGTNGGTPIADVHISAHTDKIDLPTPSRNGGWMFEGWYDNADCSGTALTGSPVYAAGGGDITLYAKWSDSVPPVILLKNGIAALTIVEKDKGGTFAVVKGDVTAEDTAWGVLDANAITVLVKAPAADSFVAWDDFRFDDTKYGNYTVRYTATDGSGNSAQVERVIRYIAALPSITIDGVKPSSGYENHRIELPQGTAAGDVTVTVTFNGEPVAITNGGFTADKAGTYTVVYHTQDAYGNEAEETILVEILADNEKPIVTVDFTATRINTGSVFTLPTASVSDNVDTGLVATVSVTFNGNAVEVTNGQFTATENGIYTVTYSVTDVAGNTTTVGYDLIAAPPPVLPSLPKGVNLGLAVGLPIGLVGAFAILGVAVWLILRRRRQATAKANDETDTNGDRK